MEGLSSPRQGSSAPLGGRKTPQQKALTMTSKCVRDTGGLPDDPCWCGVCGEDDMDDHLTAAAAQEAKELADPEDLPF